MRHNIKKKMHIILMLLLITVAALSLVACDKIDDNSDSKVAANASGSRPDWADDATTFRVEVSKEDNTTSVDVYEGSVDVTTEDKEITLNEGESLTIEGDEITEGSVDYESLPDNTKEKIDELTDN